MLNEPLAIRTPLLNEVAQQAVKEVVSVTRDLDHLRFIVTDLASPMFCPTSIVSLGT